MSFRRYPCYKQTDAEALGSLPAHWPVMSLGRVTRSKCDGPFGSGLKSDHYTDKGALVVRLQNIRPEGFAIGEPAYVEEAYFDRELRSHEVLAGDLLIAGLGDDNNLVGRACVAPDGLGKALVKADVFRFRIDTNKCLPDYLAMLLSATADSDGGRLASGSTRQRIPLSEMASRAIACPPRDEQAAIVSFINSETANIDALIEEQKRLIELLKEKRQAVISKAVTKGMDPNAPMKDSGVKWLGPVPAHWTVCTLRRLITRIEQGWSPECEAQPADDESWGVLKAGCVNRGVFNPEENKTLPESLSPVAEYEVRAGDVLISRASGSPELVGSTALVEETRPRLMLSDKIFRVHLEIGQVARFFVWAMNAKYMREQIEQSLSGGNGLANNLPQSVLLSFYCAVPPEPDQIAIGQWLNREAARLDSLLAEATALIELLVERRSALISAAVIGKIDVRGLEPQPEGAAA